VAGGEDDEHEPDVVRGDEVAAEGAEDIISRRPAVNAVELGLGEVSERSGRRECYVLEGDAHVRPSAGLLAAMDSSEYSGGEVQAGSDVPRGDHAVAGHERVARTGQGGEAGGGLDRVVDGGTAVAAAGEQGEDEVGATVRQPRVGEVGIPLGVGDHDRSPGIRRRCAGAADQVANEGAALVPGHVDGEGALALVQTDQYRLVP
jgi:hypothetical protein